MEHKHELESTIDKLQEALDKSCITLHYAIPSKPMGVYDNWLIFFEKNGYSYVADSPLSFLRILYGLKPLSIARKIGRYETIEHVLEELDHTALENYKADKAMRMEILTKSVLEGRRRKKFAQAKSKQHAEILSKTEKNVL